MSPEYYMKILAKVAEEVNHNFKIASCLVYKDEIISLATNSPNKSHPFQLKFAKKPDAIFWHSETRCIHKALRTHDESILKKSSLYVCRIDSQRQWKIAKPCVGCTKAIHHYGIPKVHYTINSDSGFEYGTMCL